MRKIHVEIDTGFCGAVHEVDIEVEDNSTDHDIDQCVQDLVWEYISTSWKEV